MIKRLCLVKDTWKKPPHIPRDKQDTPLTSCGVFPACNSIVRFKAQCGQVSPEGTRWGESLGFSAYQRGHSLAMRSSIQDRFGMLIDRSIDLCGLMACCTSGHIYIASERTRYVIPGGVIQRIHRCHVDERMSRTGSHS